MNPKERIHKDWYPVMNLLYQEPLKTLSEKILPEISFQPSPENIFRVFEKPISDIKVVILGQDPYPSPQVANGLAFAVNEETATPVSLKNILTQLEGEYIFSNNTVDMSKNIDTINQWKTLQHWEAQGVLLLNTALTVETGKPGSHLKYWEEWTKRVIRLISTNNPCIWLFWGRKAQNYIPYINGQIMRASGYTKETIDYIPINSDFNYIFEANHPASEAYSDKAGFFGCNHFYYVNSILRNKSINEIKW